MRLLLTPLRIDAAAEAEAEAEAEGGGRREAPLVRAPSTAGAGMTTGGYDGGR